MQEQYGVELVNNEIFLDWSVSDWDQTWKAQNSNETAPIPYDDYNMRNYWISSPNGAGKKNLRTTEQVDRAIDALFWFRGYNGLEDYSHSYEIDTMDWNDYQYDECSQNTKALA